MAGLNLPASARGGVSRSADSDGTTSGPSAAGAVTLGVPESPESGGMSDGVEHAASRIGSRDRLRMRFMSKGKTGDGRRATNDW
ncbi:hypothetical protein D3C78_1651670 [compost metagenome]